MKSRPPGVRFHPTGVELVMYYLKRKVMGKRHKSEDITELDVYKFAPWDLKNMSLSKDLIWFFLCPRAKKYANPERSNRATDCGYWKSTGNDRSIVYDDRTVGKKKTLVFYKGKPPQGDRTDWVMHEYRLVDPNLGGTRFPMNSYVVCEVYEKSGPGPKNGEQYGAPFREDEWDDDEDDNDDNVTDGGVTVTVREPSETIREPSATVAEPAAVAVQEDVSAAPSGPGNLDDSDELEAWLNNNLEDLDEWKAPSEHAFVPFDDLDSFLELDDLDGTIQK